MGFFDLSTLLTHKRLSAAGSGDGESNNKSGEDLSRLSETNFTTRRPDYTLGGALLIHYFYGPTTPVIWASFLAKTFCSAKLTISDWVNAKQSI